MAPFWLGGWPRFGPRINLDCAFMEGTVVGGPASLDESGGFQLSQGAAHVLSGKAGLLRYVGWGQWSAPSAFHGDG